MIENIFQTSVAVLFSVIFIIKMDDHPKEWVKVTLGLAGLAAFCVAILSAIVLIWAN